jgi:hypothetical protein
MIVAVLQFKAKSHLCFSLSYRDVTSARDVNYFGDMAGAMHCAAHGLSRLCY